MKPQRPQNINDEQWKALRKALSYSRVTRFKSVGEFIDALDEGGEETISFEAPERFGVDDDGGSPGKWAAIIAVLLGLAGIAAQQLGYLDPWIEQFSESTGIQDIAGPEPILEELEAEAEPEIMTVGEPVTDGSRAQTPDEGLIEETVGELEVAEFEEPEPEPVVQYENLVDYSTLPPPAAIVTFALDAKAGDSTRVLLREDGDSVIVDFVRQGDLAAPLALRLEEIGFSGNRSPWGAGQYALSNAGLVAFPAGQERARITLTAASDPRREADQQSTLRLRLADSPESELAIINVTLEDDDQRAFEGRLPTNTIAFAASQVSVSEADPAVQIDIVRFNPDSTSVVVGYTVEDLTATEGEDYFATGTNSISFGPGQRSARLLIPLVQDSRAEGDEAFVVKLAVDHETRPSNVSSNIAVMIRDDEQ